MDLPTLTQIKPGIPGHSKGIKKWLEFEIREDNCKKVKPIAGQISIYKPSIVNLENYENSRIM